MKIKNISFTVLHRQHLTIFLKLLKVNGSLEQTFQVEKEAMTKCPICGTDVPPLRFCTNCGAPLKQDEHGKENESLAPSKVSREGMPSSEETFQNADEMTRNEDFIRCPLCREKVPKSHSYCYLCGANLHPESARQNQILDLKICPRCQKTNPSGVGFCMHCGLVLPLGQKNLVSQFFQVSRGTRTMTVEDFNNFELNLVAAPPMDPEMQSQILKGLNRGRIIDNQIRNVKVEHSQVFEVPFLGKKKNTWGMAVPFLGSNLIHFLIGWMIIFSLLLGWFLVQDNIITIFDFNQILTTNPLSTLLAIAGISFYVMLVQFMPSAAAIYSFYKKNGIILQFKLNFQQVTFLIFLNMIISFLGFFPMPIIFRLGMLDFALTFDRTKIQKKDLRNLETALGNGSLLSMLLVITYAIITAILLGIPGVIPSLISYQIGTPDLNFFFEFLLLYGYAFIYFTGFFLIFTFPTMKDLYVQSFMKTHRPIYMISWFILLLIFFHFVMLLSDLLFLI